MINEISHYPYFHKTKIPIPDLDSNYVLEVHSYNLCQYQENLKNLNLRSLWKDQEIDEKLKKINLYPSKIRIFKWPEHQTYFPWHIDGKPNLPSLISINWIISGKGTVQWNPDIVLSGQSERAYSYRTISDHNDIAKAESDGHCCLLNTFIPHRVVNTNNNSRFSLTLQFPGGGIPFLEAVEKLRSVDLLY